MIVGKLSIKPRRVRKPTANQLQAQRNFEAFIFRDTFTREKYPLRTLNTAATTLTGKRFSAGSFHQTILAKRNNQLMQGYLTESTSRWAKRKKMESVHKADQAKGIANARSSDTLAVEQSNLRQYLRGKHKPKLTLKENRQPWSQQRNRRSKLAAKKLPNQPIQQCEEDKLYTNVCQQIQQEVRSRLTEEFSHLIKPDAFSVQYSSPLLQKFTSKRIQEFQRQHDVKSDPSEDVMSRSQELFRQQNTCLEGYIDEIEELKAKHLRQLMPKHVSEAEQQFLTYAQKGDHFEVEYMLRKSPELLNCRSAKGNTALHYACKRGDLDLAKFLITRSADLQLKNKFGMRAVQLARHFDHATLVELLTTAMARQELLLERNTANKKRLVQ